MPPEHTDPVLIHVVDDDDAFRRSLLFLLESVGWPVAGHASADAFLAASGDPATRPAGCLIVDIRMPRMSGLELQRRLNAAGADWPILFITGHGDVELAVQAMKAGARDFLQKPFRDQLLLDAVDSAVRADRAARAEAGRRLQARATLARLTPREHEVALHLARGLANKEVARALAISDSTVHIHRQNLMDKTGCHSAAELARLFLASDPAALD